MIQRETVPGRLAAAVAVVLLLLPLSSGASEPLADASGRAVAATLAEPDLPSPDASAQEARAANTDAWRGRFCLSPTCRRTPASRVADTMAFGGAIVGVAWISRRRALPRG